MVVTAKYVFDSYYCLTTMASNSGKSKRNSLVHNLGAMSSRKVKCELGRPLSQVSVHSGHDDIDNADGCLTRRNLGKWVK